MISSTSKNKLNGKAVNKRRLPYLSREERAKIVALKVATNMSNTDIAASIGCSASTVKRVFKAAKQGRLGPTTKTGRPKKVSEKIRKQI